MLLASGARSLDYEGATEKALIPFSSRDTEPLRSSTLKEHFGDRALRPVREAAEKLKQQAEALPGKPDAHFHLARASLLLGQKERAREEIKETLRIDKTFVPALSLKAQIDGMAYDAEENTFGLQEDQQSWKNVWIKGREAIRKRKWDAAEKAYNKLIKLCEEGREPYIGFKTEAHLTRGSLHLKQKRWLKAVEDFGIVRSRVPVCLETELLLGKTYYLFGRHHELSEYIDEAAGIFAKLYDNPEMQAQEPAFWIAAVYLSVNDCERTEKWAVKTTNSALKYFLLARSYFKQNRWKAAEGFGRKAVEADPDNLSAHLFIGKSILNRIITEETEPTARSLSQLIDTCRRALELDSENRQSRFLLRSIWSILHKKKKTQSITRSRIMKMKDTIMTMVAAAGIALASAELMGAEKICDDWADGDPFDGEPYMWQTSADWPGTFEPADGGGLEVVNLTGYHTGVGTTRTFSGDIKVHIRGNFNNTDVHSSRGSDPGIAANIHMTYSKENYQGYMGIIKRNGRIKINKWPEQITLETADIGFDVAEDDLDLELLRCGNKLEVRVWKSNSKRPKEPQCSATDASLYSGGASISGAINPGSNPVIYRSICITPDPCECTSCEELFIRGDANCDDAVDISDPIFILSYMFSGGDAPSCMDAADANDDSAVDISDAVSILSYLFGGEISLPEPFESCGTDPEPADALTCGSYPPCGGN